MDSLISILSHPYLVLNHMAESLYDEEGAATHQRLRSRLKKRHRFSVSDYKLLRKETLAFSRWLDRQATKLEQLSDAGQASPKLPTRLLQHPWLNQKALLNEIGVPHELSYYQVYDRLRSRTALPPALVTDLAAAYREFAGWLREQLELAQQEQKTYAFSQGRGAGSHKKTTQQ